MKYVFANYGRFLICRDVIVASKALRICNGVEVYIVGCTKRETLNPFGYNVHPIDLLRTFTCPNVALIYLMNMEHETAQFFNRQLIMQVLI